MLLTEAPVPIAADVERKDSMIDASCWQPTCETAVNAIVSLKYYRPRAFDTDEYSYTAEATGFVVDRERGLVLTNRV